MTSAVRRTHVCLFLALGTALSVAPPASAQTVDGSERLRRTFVSLGDSARIRLFAPGIMVEDGLFLGFAQDSVTLADADARFSVGLNEIEGLDVEGSRWFGIGLQTGAVALVAGAAAGFFLGYFNCGDNNVECDGHAAGVAARWGLVFGTAGGAAGALVGSRMHKWRPVFP